MDVADEGPVPYGFERATHALMGRVGNAMLVHGPPGAEPGRSPRPDGRAAPAPGGLGPPRGAGRPRAAEGGGGEGGGGEEPRLAGGGAVAPAGGAAAVH